MNKPFCIETRISLLNNARVVARVARLFRIWGSPRLANAAAARKRELAARNRTAGSAAYNHQ